MTTTVSTLDQLAASRMLCARLHEALKAARDRFEQMKETDADRFVDEVAMCNEALEHSEPEIHALRTDAERAHREGQRLREARTYGALYAQALIRLVERLEGVPLNTAGQEAVTAAMVLIAHSSDTTQLVDDIRAVTGAVLASSETEELREPAQRIIDAFGPGA